MNRLFALTVKRWLMAILTAVPLLVASTAWADAPDAGWSRQVLRLSSTFCANYGVSGIVTRPGDTGGDYGTPAAGDRFTFVATGNGTGTWRIVDDPSGVRTLTPGGVFPGSLTYTVPAGGMVTGVGFFVDTYAGNGDTITGSCTDSLIPALYVLSVAKSGTGAGTVRSSPAGINCGATCSASFAGGTQVTLSATPASGSTFAGWSGACSGTGSCSVVMEAAKSVGASFNLVPFTVSTTGVSAGVISAPVATVTNQITFNAADVGKPGSVFVTAWVPVGGLGALGISVADNSQVSVTSSAFNPGLAAGQPLHLRQGALAERDAGEFVLVQLTASGWRLVESGQLIPYASGVLGESLASQTILTNTSTAALAGAQFCVGYGSSASQMITTGTVQLIASVADPSAASAASGSCLVNQMVVNLEEPVAGGSVSGIGNVRGWAVSLRPIQRMELYIDGSLAFTVPYGGSRSDVGAAYASYPGATNSGFSMAYNFGLLAAGGHSFMTRAVDSAGNVTDASATVTVVRFPSSYIADAAQVSLVGASASIVDAHTLRLDNVLVQGISYTLSLRWSTAAQGFALSAISALAGTSTPLAGLGARAAGDLLVNLEEPLDGGTASGVGNVRGWALGLAPIQRMELYIDGSLAFTVPYGGSRSDVGAAYASYPGATNSGFSMAYNFGLLSAGSHSFLTRAVDSLGNVKDASASFTVVRFPSSYIADPAQVSLGGASATHS